jgi:hypothetical protein
VSLRALDTPVTLWRRLQQVREKRLNMNRDELVDQLIALLRQHKAGLRGSIQQDPYKQDFFRLFAAAYNAGMMGPDAPKSARAGGLIGSLVTRAPELVKEPAWDTLYQFWSEWTYAWDHANQIER